MTSPPLALTMGDPAGIGAEITGDAWRALRDDGPAFFAIDDPDRLAAVAPVRAISSPEEAVAAFAVALPVLAEPLPVPPAPGAPDPRNAPSVIRSIERAVAFARSGEAAGVVTNPINKKALYDGANFSFPGHTEFLGHLCGGVDSVMMLAGPGLRVVPATIHIALSEVPAALTEDLISNVVTTTAKALRRDFDISAPRIAIAGLNPHAGEGGAMGREEIEVIAPAIETLRAAGMDVSGPLPADTMFHQDARARYDAAVCMYHDQALIPLKALDFYGGVNVTLGLPIIRTSPDHGTGYDIAGKGLAHPDSLIAALKLAGEMAATRRRTGE